MISLGGLRQSNDCMRPTDGVLKEVANTKVFTALDFWGTHEGNLEIDDMNEARMFDEADGANPVSGRSNGNWTSSTEEPPTFDTVTPRVACHVIVIA